MDTTLFIVIPFRNEKEELRRTLLSIREQDPSIQVIVINDGSTDGYNYKAMLSGINAIYLENRRSIGVAKCRELGIAIGTGDNVLLLDAHMRLHDKDFVKRIQNCIKKDSRAIYCLNTKNLCAPMTACYGAYIDFDAMKPIFLSKNVFPDRNVVKVPCVLGAAYAFSKKFWNEFGGIKELSGYGLDEVLMSTKAYLIGGSCKLIKDLYASHLYRSQFPYENPDGCVKRNKAIVASLFFTGEELQERLKNMKCEAVSEVEPYPNIERMNEFIELNKKFKNGHNCK